MYFYSLAILASPLSSLTFNFHADIKTGTIVEVLVRNKNLKAVVISTCHKPEFKTNEILEISEFFYETKFI